MCIVPMYGWIAFVCAHIHTEPKADIGTLPHSLSTLFFKTYIYCFLILCIWAYCLYVSAPKSCNACGGQKMVLDSPETEVMAAM